MRISHRGCRIDMAKTILPDLHRCVDLVECRGVAMTQGMERAFEAELVAQRFQNALVQVARQLILPTIMVSPG